MVGCRDPSGPGLPAAPVPSRATVPIVRVRAGAVGRGPAAPQRRGVPVCARLGQGRHIGTRSGRPEQRSARGYPAAVTTPVGADPAVVGPYLASALDDERWRSVSIELIAAGMSNLTYVVTPEGGSADDAVILRRPPTGAVLATAHDMAREHRVISRARADRRAGAPDAAPVHRHRGARRALLRDGAGRRASTSSREFPPGYADGPGRSAARWASAWSTCSPTCTPSTTTAVGLGGVRPAGGVRRPPGAPLDQAVGRHPRPGPARASTRWPPGWPRPCRPTQRSSIVHGDYRLDNCLLDPDEPGPDHARSSTGRCRRSATRSPTSG